MLGPWTSCSSAVHADSGHSLRREWRGELPGWAARDVRCCPKYVVFGLFVWFGAAANTLPALDLQAGGDNCTARTDFLTCSKECSQQYPNNVVDATACVTGCGYVHACALSLAGCVRLFHALFARAPPPWPPPLRTPLSASGQYPL